MELERKKFAADKERDDMKQYKDKWEKLEGCKNMKDKIAAIRKEPFITSSEFMKGDTKHA